MDSVGVNEERCIEMIASDLSKHNWVVNYPSKLGEDSTPEVKKQLALFLVSFIRLLKKKILKKILFFF